MGQMLKRVGVVYLTGRWRSAVVSMVSVALFSVPVIGMMRGRGGYLLCWLGMGA